MTGIAIITAGREDAYQDYVQSVREGHDPAEFEGYLSDTEIDAVTDSETGKVHLWGTTVDSKWQFVEGGDIALIYRGGRYIAQATVVRTRDDLDLAEHLWRIEGNPWDPESPWRYLVFLAGVEEIDVDVESFNELTGYQDNYIPQGFSRVSDARIGEIEDSYESVETAINELSAASTKISQSCPTPNSFSSQNSRILRLAGPLIFVLSFLVWTSLLWGGRTLVFASAEKAIVDTLNRGPISWTDRLYFVGYTMFTLGNGDFVQQVGI